MTTLIITYPTITHNGYKAIKYGSQSVVIYKDGSRRAVWEFCPNPNEFFRWEDEAKAWIDSQID